MRLHRASSRTLSAADDGSPQRVRGGSDGERDRVVVAPRPGVAQRPRRAADRPGDPRGDRDPADRLHARSRRRGPAGARRAVRGPGVAAGHPRPLPGPHAGVPGRAARRPRGAPPGPAGRRRGPARGLADLRDALAPVPRDAHALLAGARLRRGVRAGRAALGRLRRPALRPPRPSDWRSRRSGRWRSSTSSGSRSWRPPTRRPRRSPTTRTWRPAAGATGSCRPSAPTRCCTSTAPAGRRTSRCSRSGRGSRSAGTATWCTRSRSVGVRSSPPVRAPRTTGTSPRTRPR